MSEILKSELSAALLSLLNPDSTATLCKTVKSKLLKHLKKLISTVTVIPWNTPKIFDGMVLFQNCRQHSRFGYIFDYVLNNIIKGESSVCFFVNNYYLENSVRKVFGEETTIKYWYVESRDIKKKPVAPVAIW